MITYIRHLFFRWLIFFKGVRFYETSIVPKTQEFQSAEFETINGHRVEFLFFREECEDLILKRGKIHREKFIGYVISARFEDNFPKDLKRFNNLKFFFNGKDFLIKDEKAITRKFLSIYLNMIRSEIEKA